MKRIVDKENLLREHLYILNDKAIRRKIINELRKLLKTKNINKILNDKKIILLIKYFNKLKNNTKKEKNKKDSKNYNNYSRNIYRLKAEKVSYTEYKPSKILKPEYVIIRQNNISINDKLITDKNINDNIIMNPINDIKTIDYDIKPQKKEKSIKKRKVRRSKQKSKGNLNTKNIRKREILQKAFEKWKNNIIEMKEKEDFKDFMERIKQINDDNKKNDDLILKKLKKANVFLLLDIYKRSRILLFNKYFNKWRNNIKKIKNSKLYINKNKKDQKLPNRYIKKKVDSNINKNKKIKDNNNNKNLPITERTLIKI